MGAAEVFQALGGGLAAVLAVAVMALFGMLIVQMNARIKDRDELIERQNLRLEKRDTEVESLTRSMNRATDLMQSWMPREQLHSVRYRSLEDHPEDRR